MIESKNLLSSIVLIRTFAILVVVLGHSMIIYSHSWTIFEPKIESNFFNNLKEYINVFQMPLFIFVSGYVLAYTVLEKSNQLQPIYVFLQRKFWRLIVPFVCVFCLYVLPIREMIHYAPYEGKSLITLFIDNVVLGKDVGHLWFLPTLFAITILYYTILYYTILYYTILYYTILYYTQKETFINKKIFGWIILMGLFSVSMASIKAPNILYVRTIAEYALYFYLGYFVRERLKGKQVGVVLIIFMFFLQFTGLITSKCMGYHNTVISTMADRVGSIGSILFFYFLFTNIDTILPNIHKNKIIGFIDKESYPIYLFHSPLMYIVLYFLADKNINPFVLVSINFVVCLFGSIGISQIIQKTKKMNFIIGK